MFMYEGPTADKLCSVGWYIHVCMFLIFIDFVRCCIYLYPRQIKTLLLLLLLLNNPCQWVSEVLKTSTIRIIISVNFCDINM